MKVAAYVHFYVPYRCAGSETMLHAMMKALMEKGHEVRVYATVLAEAPPYYEYEGVPVFVTNVVYGRQQIETWSPDVLISHHDNTDRAASISHKRNIPFVFLMHNDFPETVKKLNMGPHLTVFNTSWMRDKFYVQSKNHLVVHPPVWADQHRTTPGECVTLVNLNEPKGGKIFYELARRLPDVKFLGVEGGHGEQIFRFGLPNVVFQNQTDNMKKDVWSKTKILLMPSVYESYGMAGVEALASGIPVLANPTPGLLESQGDNGLFIDRDDIDLYQTTIEWLLNNPDEYRIESRQAKVRSKELDPAPELDAWVAKIEGLMR
jgi:glycosyltransferase involved in cell wall biosynthesis